MHTSATTERPVFLVMCGKHKAAYATTAAALYTSPTFRAARIIAERYSERWFIISAKHGLLSPTTVIAPYDMSLDECSVVEREYWAERTILALMAHLDSVERVFILADTSYSEPLETALRRRRIPTWTSAAFGDLEHSIEILEDLVVHALS